MDKQRYIERTLSDSRAEHVEMMGMRNEAASCFDFGRTLASLGPQEEPYLDEICFVGDLVARAQLALPENEQSPQRTAALKAYIAAGLKIMEGYIELRDACADIELSV